jgi:glycosyltransferase involved in cell wall biosynthesis
MLSQSISLVVPVYNEEEIIEESIMIFLQSLSQICHDYEIIVVNDGSDDKTPDILNKLSLKFSQVKVFHNNENEGSGASLWRGFQEAKKELVISNFADRPFDVLDLENIINSVDINKIDFVVVVRKDRSANTLYRKVTSCANYWLIKLLFFINISDFQFVQIYKKEILQGIDIVSKETFVPPELMFKLIKKGYEYKEVRCAFHKRPKGQSKCGSFRKVFRSVVEIAKFWVDWNILKKNV